MATSFTGAGATAFTTAAGSKTAGAVTAAIGDLLVVVVALSGNTAQPTVTDDQGGLYHEVSGGILGNTSADKLWVFIRSSFCTAAVATTATMVPSGADTGGGLLVYRLLGMLRPGADALRQVGKQANQAAGTPAPVLPAAALTGNSLIGAIMNLTNPATMTPPTVPAMTEKHDLGYITPTEGIETATVNSGFTGTTVTWGSASASAFASVIAEMNSAAAGIPRPGLTTAVVKAPSPRQDRASHVIAPRPAGLAVGPVVVVVTPPRPTVVQAHAAPHARGGHVIAPRAPSTLPPAFAKPPLPTVVGGHQRHPYGPGHVVTVRPSGLAVVVAPRRPTVVSARPNPPHRFGDVVTPRPAGLAVVTLTFVQVPRGVVVLAHATPHTSGGSIASPRPAALAVGGAVVPYWSATFIVPHLRFDLPR